MNELIERLSAVQHDIVESAALTQITQDPIRACRRDAGSFDNEIAQIIGMEWPIRLSIPKFEHQLRNTVAHAIEMLMLFAIHGTFTGTTERGTRGTGRI